MKSIRTLVMFSAILLLATQTHAATEALASKSGKIDFLNWLAGNSEPSHAKGSTLRYSVTNNAKVGATIKVDDKKPTKDSTKFDRTVAGNGDVASFSFGGVNFEDFSKVLTLTFPTGDVYSMEVFSFSNNCQCYSQLAKRVTAGTGNYQVQCGTIQEPAQSSCTVNIKAKNL